SATHDIAIDGFYLEALDERDQSNFVGYRAAAFKAAVLLVGGPIVWLCARAGWGVGLLGCAVVMLALWAVHAYLLPRSEQPRRPWLELARRASLRSLPLLAIAVVLVAVEYHLAWLTELQFLAQRMARAWPWMASVGIGGWIGIGLLLALLILLVRVPKLRTRMLAARDGGSSYAESFISFLA